MFKKYKILKVALALVAVQPLVQPLVLHSGEKDLEVPVVTMRVPGGGIQPQVVLGSDGLVHMIYFKGNPRGGDIFHSTYDPQSSKAAGAIRFSSPIRVNSQPGSATAMGNIRGAKLALGKDGRVHVSWNGSLQSKPRGFQNPELPAGSGKTGAPMLYSRSNSKQNGFEPQRNLMQKSYGLDGGGAVSADSMGNVYVTWHASEVGGAPGEAGRCVWVAKSSDDGKSFSPEIRANKLQTGACSCCGLQTFVDHQGNLHVLYRSAMKQVNRDMYHLVSKDGGKRFRGAKIDTWRVNKCVMSSASFFEGPAHRLLAAWETREQVYFGAIGKNTPGVSSPLGATGDGKRRKYPVICSNKRGEILLAWTEDMGWNRGGAVAWQVFDQNGRPIPDGGGKVKGVPTWSLVAAFPRTDGGFVVVY